MAEKWRSDSARQVVAFFAVEVGSPVTGRPPRRSRREELPHRARQQDARWTKRRERSCAETWQSKLDGASPFRARPPPPHLYASSSVRSEAIFHPEDFVTQCEQGA